MDDYLTVADQLKMLFDLVRHSDGRIYLLHEVSEGTGISLSTLSQMRAGKIRNPQLNTLRALCRFFEVPLRYFETRTPEECYAIIADRSSAAKTPVMSEIAFRASSLPPRAQQDILTVIKWVQAAEQQRQQDGGLPPLPSLEPEDSDSDAP
jgi:transcriptional regulator with XRE-family HTH domain